MIRRLVCLAMVVAGCGAPTDDGQGAPSESHTEASMPNAATTPRANPGSSVASTSTQATPSSSPPTSSTVTTSASVGAILAIDLLATIEIADEHGTDYDRDAFGYPADLDGDGCNTRAEVLKRDSITYAQIDLFHCTVVAGDWFSWYDGFTLSDPGDIDIDHVVALKEAWDSGAWQWSPAAMVAFGNDLTDPRSLLAVSSGTNRDKGASDPADWLPPDSHFLCPFIGDWVAIKARWGLTMDQREHDSVQGLLTGACVGWHVAPIAPPPTSTASVPATGTTTVPGSSSEIHYANCAAVRAAGAAPLLIGEPGYRAGLDGDSDGIACE